MPPIASLPIPHSIAWTAALDQMLPQNVYKTSTEKKKAQIKNIQNFSFISHYPTDQISMEINSEKVQGSWQQQRTVQRENPHLGYMVFPTLLVRNRWLGTRSLSFLTSFQTLLQNNNTWLWPGLSHIQNPDSPWKTYHLSQPTLTHAHFLCLLKAKCPEAGLCLCLQTAYMIHAVHPLFQIPKKLFWQQFKRYYSYHLIESISVNFHFCIFR